VAHPLIIQSIESFASQPIPFHFISSIMNRCRRTKQENHEQEGISMQGKQIIMDQLRQNAEGNRVWYDDMG
jgi:hypothetical protein